MKITFEQCVHFGVACVHDEGLETQGAQFSGGADHDDVFTPDLADHFGTDLLVAAPEEESLPADGCDDDSCRHGFKQI